MTAIGLILIACAAAAFLIYRSTAQKSQRLAAELEDFCKNAVTYSACVLDVHEEEIALESGKKKNIPVLIIQFRIEEQKRTVIHRCTEPFFKNYSRGDTVEILFMEMMPADRVIIGNDNLASHTAQTVQKIKFPCLVGGTFAAVLGAVITVMQCLQIF